MNGRPAPGMGANRLHAEPLLGASRLDVGGRAGATPEFPAVVEKTLDLSKIEIDPPQGCTLCHTTDAGGPSLRTFGLLVQQYGAQPYQDSTLVAALGEVQQKDPQLIADIKAGNDPNEDPAASSLPTPSMGARPRRGRRIGGARAPRGRRFGSGDRKGAQLVARVRRSRAEERARASRERGRA